MCTQPIHICDCEPCDLARRAAIQAKCAEIFARFKPLPEEMSGVREVQSTVKLRPVRL